MMAHFDGNYTLEILVWATSFVPLQRTWGLGGTWHRAIADFSRLSEKASKKRRRGWGSSPPSTGQWFTVVRVDGKGGIRLERKPAFCD